MERRTFFAGVGSALLGLGAWPKEASAHAGPHGPRGTWSPGGSWRGLRPNSSPLGPLKLPEKGMPNVTLLTHENKKVRFYDDLIRGNRIVAINLMYAQCGGICPTTTANLARVYQALGERAGRDVFLYSITVQPEADTPAVLKDYARAFGAGPGWLFLTGRRKNIELIRRRLGLVDPDPQVDNQRDSHTGMLVFGNDAIDRWAACPALQKPRLIVRSLMWVEGPRPA